MFVVFTIGLVLTTCVMANGELLSDHELPEDCFHQIRRSEEFILQASFMTERSNALKDSIITARNIMAYDYVRSNVGSYYKPASSIFITPVDGTYVFYLAASSNYNVELGIFHNNFEVGKVNNDLKSSTVIIELNQGDTIYVIVNSAPENATLSHGRFGGFLLTKKYRYY